MALLNRKRVVLAKIESVYGTDPVPTGPANAMLVRNLTVSPIGGETVDRDLVRPYLGQSEQLPALQEVSIEFEIEAQGSGTAGTVPAYDCLLRACGFSSTNNPGVSQVYAPISAAFESVTIYVNVDGVLHKVTGARGNLEISLDAKGIPVMKFRFLGLYNTVTDTAAPTPTYTGFKSPLVANSVNTPTFTLHALAAVMQNLSINLNNGIVHRSLIGLDSVILADRKVSGSVTIEANTVAAKDWYTITKNATLAAMQLIHGTAAGFKFQVDAPNVQITNPRYSDSDGVAMLQLDVNMIPSSAGNDELTITVK